MSIREDQVEGDLITLDDAYTAGTLCSAGFYEVLEKYGIKPSKSVMLEVFPDSGTTLTGSLLDEYGDQWNFDIDYVEKLSSELIRVDTNANRRSKWHTKVKLDFALKLLAEKQKV